MKKPGIPDVPKPGESRERFDGAVKQTLETLTGARGTRIKKLASDAALADVISKINEILDVLQ